MKLSISISLLYSMFFFSAIQLKAQSPCEELYLPKEHVSLQLDRNVCLAGETIWFKAWCFLDGQLEQEMSKVLYVEIFDESQEAIVQEKYLLTDNKAAGAIRIPEDVASKYYFVRAYTRYMRNFSSADFHYQQIIIVNPFIEGGKIEADVTSSGENKKIIPVPEPIRHNTKNSLQIALDKEKYQTREQIIFHINSIQSITAELSVSVRMKGLGNQPSQKALLQNECLIASCQEDPFCWQHYFPESPSNNSSNSQEQKDESTKQLQWLPETRGLTIGGLVQNQKQENVAGALTMVAALQKEPLLHIGTTDEDGAFTICLQNMQQQQDLFVGTPNGKNNVLIRNDFDPNYPKITSLPLQYDSSLHRLLESLNLHQQLNQIYPKNKTQKSFQARQLNLPSANILAPDRRINLSDFIKLSTMSEVFKEVIPGVLLRKIEGKENLSVFNSEQQRWYDSPLILLDNVPIFNIAELLKIDPAKVEAIEIYDSDYILGDYTIGAIISIISKTDDFAGYQWGEQAAFAAFKGFVSSQAFEQVLHLEKSHYPDFRPVLYWQPDLQLKQQKDSPPIFIYAPDRPGIYEVLVQGYTNSGEACMGYVTFEVVQDM